MIWNFFHRRVIRPLIDLLRQGTSPEKLALSMASGLVLGVFPGLGWTTPLCALVALRFRLNLPAIQLANYLVYPLQLVLFIPFIRAGEFVFRTEHLPLSLAQILSMFRTDAWHSVKVLWLVNVHAMIVWMALAAPAMYLIYRLLLPALRRLAKALGFVHPEEQAPTATEAM